MIQKNELDKERIKTRSAAKEKEKKTENEPVKRIEKLLACLVSKHYGANELQVNYENFAHTVERIKCIHVRVREGGRGRRRERGHEGGSKWWRWCWRVCSRACVPLLTPA